MQIIPPNFNPNETTQETKQEVKNVLEWLLEHGHGGGNWRRIITLKRDEYED